MDKFKNFFVRLLAHFRIVPVVSDAQLKYRYVDESEISLVTFFGGASLGNDILLHYIAMIALYKPDQSNNRIGSGLRLLYK